ncbi:MAG: hypothetical protein ACOX6P_07330 [Candidatus Merdivicinus sp.]
MKKTNQIALGGMMAALSIVCMLLTGVFPMADFALPAIAGLLLVPIVIDAGYKGAWTAFGAVALLSAMIAPNKECALYYIAFLGFYPIVKSVLECRKGKIFPWICKILLFNLCAAVIVAGAMFVFRFPGYAELLEEAWWLLAGGWIFLNAVFVVYDIALTQLITAYVRWFRPKYILKIFK